MNNVFQIIIICVGLLLFSCEKVPVTELNQEFIGDWKHNSDEKHSIYLQIEKDSRGYIEKYENTKFKSDTQNRKWLIKKDKLYFGWLSSGEERFSIDAYPIVSNSLIVNGFDTIQSGDKYMVLDGNYFKN